jgi:protease-4
MGKLLLLSLAALLVPLVGADCLRAAPEKNDKKAAVKATIAVFRLRGTITEAPAQEAIPFLSDVTVSFKDLVARFKKAVKDDSVKAIVLLAEGASLGTAQIEELRQVMKQVRAAGKDIYVHSDSMSMSNYLLFSGASRISVVPTGDVWITGLYGEAPYVRGLLDLIGIKPDFIHMGAYKSASEIFMRKGPSPEAEKMQNWLLDSVFNTYVKLIAQGRGVKPEKVKAWIDDGPYTAEKAKKAGLVDAVEHRQDFAKMLKNKYGKDLVFNKRYGKKKQPKFDVSNPFSMIEMWAEILGGPAKKKKGKNGIAIVYVEGAISLGGGEPSIFGSSGARSSTIRKALDDAAKDDTVKAVVLRVNSPGGSAVASEIILDATRRVKAKKPLVVSMGNVAASGGYYVACASDVIYADDATITGSIGVVGGKLVTNGMWNKIGITFKAYQRGKNAGILSSAQVFSHDERERITTWMNDIYKVFKGHVVAIRGKKLKKDIDELAGGRVYTGRQALELGLVDKIGGLEDAIHHAADQAKVTDYDVRVIPPAKNLIELLLEEMGDEKDNSKDLGLAAKRLVRGPKLSLMKRALPYLKDLDPQRVRMVFRALEQLQLMQRESVLMMMPEWRLRQ